MEWESKSCAWNAMSKLELQDNMFSVDLKLGSLEHLGDVAIDTLNNSGALTMTTSSPSPSLALSKRGRPRSGGYQSTVYCSVDGCISDLSQGREYHRRHRVCERHSKTPVVLIGGREQRFCQQCSRFHSLGEFDNAKRSCRKRLDGHNRRRRKSQTGNIYMTNSGGFQTGLTGNEVLQLCCPDNWPVNSEHEKALVGGVNHPISSLWSTSCVKGDNRSPYISGINQQMLFLSPPNGISSTGTMTSSLEGSSDRLTDSTNSGCALSLLSDYSTQSSGMCMGPTISSMATSSSSQVSSLEDKNSAQVSIFEGFHSGHDGFSENRSSYRLFPFSWQ